MNDKSQPSTGQQGIDMTERRAPVVNLTTRAAFRPDLGGLAREQIAITRRRMSLSHRDFATALARILDWTPTPEAVESWETLAVPPGDVLIAAGMLGHRHPDGPHAMESDLVAEIVRDRFADLTAVYATRSELLSHMPPHALFSGGHTIRAAGLSLNILCQQLSDSAMLQMIKTGTSVECLFLDPNGRAVQDREREEGHSSGYLSALTTINIQALGRLRQQLPDRGRDHLHVRVYDETLRYNLTFVDDSLGVVQPYLHRSRGVDAPAFVFHRDDHRTTGLYPAFDQVYRWLREQSVEHGHD